MVSATRNFVRVLALVALSSAILCGNTAEAGFLDGLMKGITNQIKGMVDKIMKDTVKKFSVLSGIFGGNVTRADLKFGQIVNGAFSRRNAVRVNNTAVDADWKVDGNRAVAAIVSGSGGKVSVAINGASVSASTSSSNKGKGSDAKKDKDGGKEDAKGGGHEESKKEGRKGQANDKGETDDGQDNPRDNDGGSGSPDDEVDEGDGVEETASPIEVLDNLIENWDVFMNHSIWDAQDENQAVEKNSGTKNTNGGNSSDKEDDENIEGRSTRIVNGLFFAEALASGSRFVVKFFYDDEANFYCGGSLIGYPYVLTSAHCGIVEGDNVRVGGRQIRSGYKATVEQVIIHPNFNRKTLVSDIAIVKLSGLEDKRVLLDNGVEAARINRNRKYPRDGDRFLVSGHGSKNENGKGVAEELLSTRQTVHEHKKCVQEITQGELKHDKTYLCAGDGARSTSCVGDSGTALWRYVVKTNKKGKVRARYFEIIGVVSFGEVTDESLCPRGPPTVYQRVAEHQGWITAVVGKKNLAR